VPKPFRGLVGAIQENALASWSQLQPQPRLVLVGDEEGVADAAERFAAVHVAAVERNKHGTPLLDSVFDRAEAIAETEVVCFVNADVLLFDDLVQTVELVRRRMHRFLVAGRGWRLDPPERAELAAAQTRARRKGRLRSTASAEYFAFPTGLFRAIPPFAVGRSDYDLWLLWRARKMRVPVVDATPSVVAVHQEHGYDHVPGGRWTARVGPEARSNRALRGRFNFDSLRDARYVVRDGRLRRNPLSVASVHHRAWVAKLWLAARGRALAARASGRREAAPGRL
jgi:hypothetical protein